jgi:hypothetical protein
LSKLSFGLKPDTSHTLQQRFDQDRVKGAAAKEILRGLLESSEYDVYPFGYESTLSVLKRRLGDKRLGDNPVSQRIRSMPDFLVTDRAEEEPPQLVEVKFRKAQDPPHKIFLKNWDLERYKRYWPESVLVLLSPFGDRFFVQHMKNLELDGDSYGHTWFEYTDFGSISSIFPRTTGKLGPFHVGIDKLAGLWHEEKD